MNGIFIIPTGIGCDIGGHAGDAVCSANLIASLCDRLIVNPNAVNASDINEMASNCLYVEGSLINDFIRGDIRLQESRRNKILLVVNAPVSPHTINSVNAARVSLGVDIEIVELEVPVVLEGWLEQDGMAGGKVSGIEELLTQIIPYKFDALAVQTPIDVSIPVIENYLSNGGVNPWGGVEARASRAIASTLRKPVAHAPMEREDGYFKNYAEVVNPRLSAEMVSVSYLHCVLKGLARAPRIITKTEPYMVGSPTPTLWNRDFDFLVTPDRCFGEPHIACLEHGIEVIVVVENFSVLSNSFPDKCTFVRNYLECAGYIACKKAGIGREYVSSGIRIVSEG